MKYYKYVTFDVLTKILENESIKVTYPAEFNDPFDCDLARIDLESSKIHNDFMKKSLEESEQPLHLKHIIENISPVFIGALNNVFVELLEKWNKEVEKIRVLSLTESPDNILMWSHYADNHSGAVIELEFPNKERNLISEVNYGVPMNFASTVYNEMGNLVKEIFKSEVGEKFKIFEFENKEEPKNLSALPDIISKATKIANDVELISTIKGKVLSCAWKIHSLATQNLSNKLSIWDYEKEHRMILVDGISKMIKLDELTLLPLSNGCIKKVIFGVNSTHDNRRKVKNILREKYPTVKISTAVKANWKITFEECHLT